MTDTSSRPRPDSADVQIVPARREHAQAAVQITAEAFSKVSFEQASEALVGPATGQMKWQDIKGQEVRGQICQEDGHSFVAVRGGQTIGYVTNEVDFRIGRGRIINLAVDASCRGGGIGRRLIEVSLEHFRQLGLTQAKIETLANNQAGQHLYPAMGFQEVVRQIHYIMKL